jgi:osmoprotectant transport system permease protein
LVQQKLYKEPGNGNKGIIRMGSKIFGEQYILLQMYTMLVRGYTDLNVDTKTGLGGTKICFDALTNDQIDLYPEYTGTGLLVILQPSSNYIEKIMGNKEQVYNYVQQEFIKRYNIKWLKPIGFNNAYALMMRRKQASELGIQTISQLKMFIDNN